MRTVRHLTRELARVQHVRVFNDQHRGFVFVSVSLPNFRPYFPATRMRIVCTAVLSRRTCCPEEKRPRQVSVYRKPCPKFQFKSSANFVNLGDLRDLESYSPSPMFPQIIAIPFASRHPVPKPEWSKSFWPDKIDKTCFLTLVYTQIYAISGLRDHGSPSPPKYFSLILSLNSP